jgi:hypothetical protein
VFPSTDLHPLHKLYPELSPVLLAIAPPPHVPLAGTNLHLYITLA